MARDVTIVLKATDQYSSTLQQFNKDVGNIATTTSGLSESGTKANTMMNGFVNSLNAAAVGFIGWKGAQMVSDLTEMGTQANKAKQVFDALTGPMGGYTQNIDALRKATGGVVDNMTLMEGASKLVQMGLATNTEELSSMYEMATKLGSSMGMDVTKSLSDFSLMLANNSIMRLDQFGISSGRVRDRMNELADQFGDMSKSDRFKLAVLEEGQAALDRLGTAATAAETPLARIGTSITNMAQAFAGDFSTGVNSLAGILEIATGSFPGMGENQSAIEAAATANAAAYADRFREALGADFQATSVADLLLNSALKGQMANPGASLTDIVQQAWSSLNYNDTVGSTEEDQQRMMAATYMMLEQKQNAESILQTQQENAATNDRVNAIMLEQLAIQGDITAEQETYQRNLAAIQQLEAEDAERQEVKRLVMQGYNDDLMHISNALSSAYEIGGFTFNPQMMGMDLTGVGLGGSRYMTREQANGIADAYGEIQNEMTRIQELADKDLISKEELDRAQGMADNLKLMKDQAEAAAEAFENLKLSDVFGQGGGGMQGEMTDMILQQMKASGAAPEAIAAMERQLNLSSGRETDTSLLLKEQIVPQMAAMAPELAATMVENFNTIFKEAALQGLNQDQIGKLMQDTNATQQGYNPYAAMVSFGMAPADATQFSGGMWGDTTLTQQLSPKGAGKTLADTTAGMKGDMTSINKDATSASKMFQTIEDAVGASAGFMKNIRDAINQVSGTQEIRLKFTADDPMGLVGLIKGLLGGNISLEGLVRDNGGTVPGMTGNHAGQGGV